MPSRAEIEAANRKAGQRLLAEGEQLGLFEADGKPVAVERRAGPGRPAGSGNKVKGKLRDWLAHRGHRDPAEQLAMIAGLDQAMHPMAYAAEVAAALGEPVMVVVREMRQAAAELMPYWHARITPDVVQQGAQVNILMQGSDGAVAMRIEGGSDPFAPLDARLGLIGESVANQGLGDGVSDGSDNEARTE